MSKELEKVKGVNVVNQYHSKEMDKVTMMMLNCFVKTDKPVRHTYYELVDKKGKVVQIIVDNEAKPVIVRSVATRLGLDYRLVEFEESWQDLDAEEDKKEEL